MCYCLAPGKANALVDEKFLGAFVRLRTIHFKRALLAAKAEALKNQDEAPIILKRLKSTTNPMLELSDARKDNKLK